MTTPTTLQLYNQALRLVGEGKLASTTANRPERHALDSIWDEDPVKQMLEKSQWGFATRTMEWNYNSAIEPGFGFRRAFTKPKDYVRTCAVCSDEYFTNPMVDYADEAGFWFADLDTIYIKYVSDGDDYGRNMALWTELFRNCVASKMAFELCYFLNKSERTSERVERLHQQYVKEARSLDAMNQPTKFMPPGSWTRSRRRGGRARSYFGPSE